MSQDSNRFRKGHVGKIWDDDFKYLKYSRQPITPYEIENWRNLGYDYVKSFTGSMYDNKNPMPNWVKKLEDSFGLHNQTYTFYKMETLEIMPTHSDHFNTYQKLFNVDISKVWRALLMLEDWKPGHYLEINGEAFVNWKAGDWFAWQGDYPHAAANIGVEPRYTLQVTGTSIYTGTIEGLVHFNVPDIPYNPSRSHPFVKTYILPNLHRPYENFGNIVYFKNGKIKELENVQHPISNRAELNKKGLHIYLYEPICSYTTTQQKYTIDNYENFHTESFYSEFSNDVDKLELRAEELDSIMEYVENNKLSNITVHTGEYNVAENYPFYSSKLNLITDDLFLKSVKKIDDLDINVSNIFSKHFISLNWRYTKHRHIISTFLANKNSHLTWNFKSPFEILEKISWFKTNELKSLHPKIYECLNSNTLLINKTGPFNVDQLSKEPVWITHEILKNIWPQTQSYSSGETPALNNFTKNTLQNAYKDAFVDIVTESRYAQPTGNLSEKILQAIQYKKPFILVAPPKSLEYLKTFGFLTFSEFWDESYDDEPDHGIRMIKILQIIDQLNNLPINELSVIYNKMLPIIEHNFSLFDKLFSKPLYII